MLPATYDIHIYQGDTWQRWMTISIAGAPVDVSGYTLAAQVRRKHSDPEILATFAIDLDPQTVGRFQLTLTPTITAALPAKDAVWDLQFTQPDGQVFTYLHGKVAVSAEVTRPVEATP